MNRISSLDGIRAICVIMVIGYHFQINEFISLENKTLGFIFKMFFNGGLAVNTFFFISSFLITKLLVHESSLKGSISLKNFYTRRVLRIFPAYYFLLLVYYLFNFLDLTQFDELEWLSCLTFLKQFNNNSSFPLTYHLWSISVEELFYLIWPVLFINFKNKSILCFSLLFSLLIVKFFLYSYPLAKYTNTIFCRGDALLLGAIYALNEMKILKVIRSFYSKNTIITLISLLILSVIANLYFYSVAIKLQQHNLSFLLNISYVFLGGIGFITNLIIANLVIVLIHFSSHFKTFLNNKYLIFVGSISYSIYLWQQLFTSRVYFLDDLSILTRVALIFIFATISYYSIEKPFLKLKYRFNKIES